MDLFNIIKKKKKKKTPDFMKIKNSFKDLPMTWYPALMIDMITQCKKAGCFKNNNVAKFVKMVELKMIDK